MRVTVLRPGELGSEEARLWAKFQQLSPVTMNPFLSLAFAQAVDRVRSNTRVAVIEEEGKIEAFLPFELASRTIAVPIGSPMNDLQGFIHSGLPIDARQVIKSARPAGLAFRASARRTACTNPAPLRGGSDRGARHRSERWL